jgi:hypothetical protein
MTRIRIEHFGGADEVSTLPSLDRVLSARYGQDANEFWLFGEPKHPSLSILVRGKLASLTYFPDEAHPGFTSEGNVPALDPDGDSIFYTNTPREEIEISNAAVVTVESALKAAHDFFLDRGLPSSLEWDEL